MTETTATSRALRGKCTPCATERKTRAALASPAFPPDFPCPHPESGPVPGFPLQYAADRSCPACGMLTAVEVTVTGPAAIGYRCSRCGGTWLAGLGAPGEPAA